MFHKKIQEVYNPIVYVFLALGVSSISYGIILYFRELSIIIVALFFLYLLIKCGGQFTCILISIFIIGIIINCFYYSVPQKIHDIVRITEISKQDILAEWKGRKLLIDINDKESIVINKRYILEGELDKTFNDKAKGIVGKLKIKSAKLISDDFITNLSQFRDKLYMNLRKNIGKSKADFIFSIAFGDSSKLDKYDREDLKKWGIVHVISISGLHVAIIYMFVKTLIGRKCSLVITMLYVIFTGASYSSIRAFVMLFTTQLAKICRRNNNSISSLSLAGIILLIYKPYSIFEISFHLSYLATVGIILYSDRIKNKMYKFGDKIRDVISISISAQIFILPYIMFIFNQFCLNFIVGNLLLIPILNILIILGNILILSYRINVLFDFFSFIILKILLIFNYTISKLYDFSLQNLYTNNNYVTLYLILLISAYYIDKGFTQFKKLPIVTLIIIMIISYNPILNIKYTNDGAVVVSYKGDCLVLCSSKKNMYILGEIYKTDKVYYLPKNIRIRDRGAITLRQGGYLMTLGDKQYFLKIYDKKNSIKDCVIINLKDMPIKQIFVLNNDLLLL